MTQNNRRTFIIQLASASAAITAGGVLSACGGSEADIRFDYGVASGDPLQDRVILWTHAKEGDFNAASPNVTLDWEVATDAGFTAIVARGQVTASASTGYTAKVDATGLAAGKSYFYRFGSGRSISPVGHTRTLPAAGVSDVKLAVFSCANYPAGYFHAYSEAVKAGAEYAIHLGDYIYEYPANGYASADAVKLGRVVLPATECLKLADYRQRYAQYRSDPDLKQLHSSLPMIAVWDDHEIANDTFKDGAENHTESTEGKFADRVAAALQAYHEWLPIRTPDRTDLRKIYRSFDFGQLLSLHMLETRLLAREKAIEVSDLLNPATATATMAAFASPTRQMLGAAQQGWLSAGMQASTATWQVLGQQVLMGRMEFPASVLVSLDPTNPVNATAAGQAAGQKAITDYLTAKGTAAQAPTMLTQAQKNLLNTTINPKLGYNLDAWDGYPVARETVLGTAAALGKRLVVLAGDTHNAWCSELTLMNGTKVGQEFATPGVSSPGLEEYLPTIPSAQAEQIFKGVIDTLKYTDLSHRGFLMMRFTPTTATGTWHLLDSVKNKSYTVNTAGTYTLNAV
jgi:alkaline phosphatase D